MSTINNSQLAATVSVAFEPEHRSKKHNHWFPVAQNVVGREPVRAVADVAGAGVAARGAVRDLSPEMARNAFSVVVDYTRGALSCFMKLS